jgi:two-component system sensor histidine kinase CpxA
MRTLFLRIFVAFWIAMGVILIAGILVTAMVASARLEALENVQPGDLALDAGEALDRAGIEGLKDWLREAERARPGLSIFVLDPSGTDLLGRELPARVRRWADRLDRRGFLDRPPPDRPGLSRHRPHHWAPQVIAPDGTPYTLFIAARGNPPFGVLGTLDVPLVLLLLALLVSGIVSWWLARYVARPVSRLQMSARALAAGDLDARVGERFASRRDELGVLARDFDQMAERVRGLIAARDLLLRDVSHELRSPLARLRVALGLARRPRADLTRELDRIEREAERLDALIGEILHLSRLSSPESPLEPAQVDVGALTAELIADAALEGAPDHKSIGSSHTEDVTIVADEGLLRSAIENVLRNAVRFTASGTTVDVRVDPGPRDVIIAVRDRGPGVPASDLEKIFEPFYRVADSRSRTSGGTGLGLAIAARIVHLHRGSIHAANADDGGLCVEIRLPRDRARSA